jgi:hypothetical protein
MRASAEPLKAEELGSSLTEARAREIFRMGEEAVVFALLAQAQALGSKSGPNKPSPSAPSGSVPPYEKPTTRSKRRKKPGRKPGHDGSRRSRPNEIDQTKVHRLANCPDCGSKLKQCNQSRTRYTEDIPEDIKPVVTEHVIHRDWCPCCQKHVEPKEQSKQPIRSWC